MVISIELLQKKAIDKSQHSFIIKAFRKQGIERNILNLLKYMNIFPLRSGRKQGYSVTPLPLNIVLEVIAREIKQEEEIKSIQVIKEDGKCLYNIIL